MELTSLLAAARAQGPVFWAATGAIALGLTLLLVAVLHRLPRPRRRRRTRTETGPPASSPAASAPEVAAAAQARTAYQDAPAAPRGVLASPGLDHDPAERSLALLLRRLQSAGDRLEELAGSVPAADLAAPQSGLKDAAPDVEYVFRACGP